MHIPLNGYTQYINFTSNSQFDVESKENIDDPESVSCEDYNENKSKMNKNQWFLFILAMAYTAKSDLFLNIIKLNEF